MESRQVGHLSFQRCQVNERIYFIGKQHGLLLMHTLLVGTHTDEEVVTRDGTSGLTHLVVIIVLMHLRCTSRVFCLSMNGNLHGMGSNLLAAGSHMGSRNRVATALVGADYERVGDRRRAAGMSVHHLERRLARRVGTGDDLQSFRHIAHTEIISILRIHGIGQAEVLTRLHTRRSIDRETLRSHRHADHHQL